jgi:hypothetical protein
VEPLLGVERAVSVAEIGALHARYIRQSDRFRSVWTYHQFASGVFKNFLNAPLPYSIEFQKIYDGIKRISGMMTETLATQANATMAALDKSLDRAAATLLTADQRIPPSMLRRFFEKLKSTDESIVLNLIKFYLYADAVEGDCRDKLDFLLTRIGEDFIVARGEYWSRDSLEFRERVIALVSVMHVADAPQEEVVRLIRAVRSLRDEIQKAVRFEELTDRNLLRNARMFKHAVGDLYFHPDVLLAIVELNVSTKNKFIKLYKAEEQKLVDDATRLMEHGGAIERNFGDANPELIEEIGRFRQYKERFDELRAQSNIKHDVITHLKASMANILAQLDRGLGSNDEETTADLPETFFDEAKQIEKLKEHFTDEVTMPALVRIASAIETVPRDVTPPDLVRLPGIVELRLEPWEVAAYRKLFESVPSDGEEDSEELWLLYLSSAALRLKIDEEATIVATATAAGIRPEADLLQRAKSSLDCARELDERFGQVLSETNFATDQRLLHQIYRSRFRLLRGFSGLWLIYDKLNGP